MPGGKSGNGWVTCAQGHQHWGLFGAAGVLVYVAHPRGLYSDEHGGWAYHTVLAQAAEPLRVHSDDYESDEAVWLPGD
jgi:hypothetical protein